MKKRDSTDGQHQMNGFPAAHPDIASGGLGIHDHPHVHNQQSSIGSADPNSITSADTPGLSAQRNPNIAPQHIFDTVSLSSDAFASPSLPAFIRQPSPSASFVNGNAANLEPPQTYDALQAQNQHLRTRVSELEVINDLFRGRVEQLELAEQDARQAEKMKDEEVERFKSDLDTANAKVDDLQKRVAELESQSIPARKRTRRNAGDEAHGEDENGDGS